jgi:hypothetical protein
MMRFLYITDLPDRGRGFRSVVIPFPFCHCQLPSVSILMAVVAVPL